MNLDTVRQRYHEARKAYATSSGPSARYYEGKMVGIVDTVADLLGISWIATEVLLGKDK